MKVIPIVLAAGESRRMGSPKALLPLRGETFLSRILGVLRELDLSPVYVVVGTHAAQVRERIREPGVHYLVNPDPGRGQISSIQLAVAEIRTECDGCLIWPVDQPAVSRQVVAGLLRLFEESGAPVVLPRCGGRRGHPAVFGSSLFAELLEAPEAGGAKAVLSRHEQEIALLETEEPATVEDIDTPEDYRRLLESIS